VQQEELRRTNAELESQAKTLKSSEEALREQQEELQQINEELEEKASLLAERNRQVEQKNEEVEAAKLAPRLCPELARLHTRELTRGGRNRATLAVARRLVAWLLAVDRRGRRIGRVPATPRRPGGRT